LQGFYLIRKMINVQRLVGLVIGIIIGLGLLVMLTAAFSINKKSALYAIPRPITAGFEPVDKEEDVVIDNELVNKIERYFSRRYGYIKVLLVMAIFGEKETP